MELQNIYTHDIIVLYLSRTFKTNNIKFIFGGNVAFSKNNPKRNPQMRDPKKRSKRRHGKRTLHHVLLILILLIAGIALSLTVFFKIESISIYGNEHYDNDELIAKT